VPPPPPAEDGLGPIGCFFAIAIGVLTVTLSSLSFSLLTGRSLNLGEEWFVFLIQMLIVAAPFGLLAFMNVGRLPWLVGLTLTLLLWGYVVFEGVSYQWHPDGSGANIGLGLFMLVSPFFVAAACVGVHGWQRRQSTALAITPETIAQLPLADIEMVTFYKLDEITTDLICCEIVVGGTVRTFHEEMKGWNLLLRHIERLPGFRADWFSALSRPAFEPCEIVAFKRA
jgi:hypothetical protein